jgi:hypothetical protein
VVPCHNARAPLGLALARKPAAPHSFHFIGADAEASCCKLRARSDTLGLGTLKCALKLNDPTELSRLVVGEPPGCPKELRHRKGSTRIVLARDVLGHELRRSIRFVIRYRIAEARKCDDDFVIDYLNSKLGRATHRFSRHLRRKCLRSSAKPHARLLVADQVKFVRSNVPNFQAHKIAASQLAVDRQLNIVRSRRRCST